MSIFLLEEECDHPGVTVPGSLLTSSDPQCRWLVYHTTLCPQTEVSRPPTLEHLGQGGPGCGDLRQNVLNININRIVLELIRCHLRYSVLVPVGVARIVEDHIFFTGETCLYRSHSDRIEISRLKEVAVGPGCFPSLLSQLYPQLPTHHWII